MFQKVMVLSSLHCGKISLDRNESVYKIYTPLNSNNYTFTHFRHYHKKRISTFAEAEANLAFRVKYAKLVH